MKRSSDAHLLSLCFDDGYAASCRAVAGEFEVRGLRAAFFVLTAPGLAEDPFIAASVRGGGIGGFDLWAELAARGHEVHPHGHAHLDLGAVASEAAEDEIEACLGAFAARLPAFEPERAVWGCTYNRASDAALAHLAGRVRAVRADPANLGVNAGPWPQRAVRAAFPLPPDTASDALVRLEAWRRGPPSWLVLCLHGLDGEGWAPVTRAALAGLLDRAADLDVEVLAPGAALDRLAG